MTDELPLNRVECLLVKRVFACVFLALLSGFAFSSLPPLFSVSAPSSVTSGQDFQVTVNLTVNCPALFPVALHTDLGYIQFKGSPTLMFRHGAYTAATNAVAREVTVPVVVVLTATGPVNSVKTSITINPIQLDDIEVFGPTHFQVARTAKGIVRLKSTPALPMTVFLHSDSPWAKVSGAIDIPAGKNYAFFSIILTRPLVDSTATITARIGSQTMGAYVSAQGPHVQSVEFLDEELPPGSHTTGRVTLEEPAPANLTVQLEKAGTSSIIPASVTIPQGLDHADFNVQIPLTAVPAFEVVVNAIYNGYKIDGHLLVTEVFATGIGRPDPVVGSGSFSVPVEFSNHVGVGYSLIVTAESPLVVQGGITKNGQTYIPVPAGVMGMNVMFSVPNITAASVAHFTARLQNIDNLRNRVSLLPTPNPAIVVTPAATNARQKTSCTITLPSAVSKDLTLNISGDGFLHLPASVTVPAGQQSVTFTFVPDHPPGPAESQDAATKVSALSADSTRPFNQSTTFTVAGANISTMYLTQRYTDGTNPVFAYFLTSLDAPFVGLTLLENYGGYADAVTLTPTAVKFPSLSHETSQQITSGSLSDKIYYLAGYTADSEQGSALDVRFRATGLNVPYLLQSGDAIKGTAYLNAQATLLGGLLELRLDSSNFEGWLEQPNIEIGNKQVDFNFFPTQVFDPVVRECRVWVAGSPMTFEYLMKVLPIDPAKNLTIQVQAAAKTATLHWQPSASHGVQYEIYRTTLAGQEPITPYATVNGSTTEFVDDNASGDTVYYYFVKARVDPASGTLRSEPSNVVSADVEKPLPPTGLEFQQSTNFAVLTWLESESSNVDHYNVYMNSGSSWSAIGQAQVGVAKFVKFLAPGKYYFRLTAVGTNGLESDPSDYVIGTISNVPDAPSAPLVSQQKHGAVVTWGAVSGVNEYVVYRKGALDLNPVPIATVAGSTSFTDPNLSAGQTYQYQVSSVSSDGVESSPSSLTSINVLATLETVTGPMSVTRGASVTVTIQLTGAASSGGTGVDYKSSDPAILASGSYSVPAGKISLIAKTQPTTVFSGAAKTISLTFYDAHGNTSNVQVSVN